MSSPSKAYTAVSQLEVDAAREEQDLSYERKNYADSTTVGTGGRPSLWRAIMENRKIVMYCLGLGPAILVFGYDYGIVGGVSAMPQFQEAFGKKLDHIIIIPSLWLALWSVASPVGAMFGALFAGTMQDRVGRRWTIATGSVIVAVGVALLFISDIPAAIDLRRAIFLAGKAIQGFSIGMMLAAVQTWFSEVLPTSLRGPILALFPVFTLFGQLQAALTVFMSLGMKTSWSYRLPLASQWPFSVIVFVTCLFLPESPAWLMRRGKATAALRAVRKLASMERSADAVFDELQQDVAAEREMHDGLRKPTYLECFKGTNRRRTLIVIFANTLPQLFGLSLLASASYFMEVNGMAPTPSLALLILGIALGLISNGASPWVLNVVGRRTLVLIGLLSTTLLWAAMGIAGLLKGPAVLWFAAGTMMAIVVVSGASVWPASYVLAAETSALALRGKTQGIGQGASAFATGAFAVALPYVYNPDAGDLGLSTGFIMAGFAAVGLVCSWFAVPEMKGRSARQIDRMFDAELPASHFKRWVDEAALTEEVK